MRPEYQYLTVKNVSLRGVRLPTAHHRSDILTRLQIVSETTSCQVRGHLPTGQLPTGHLPTGQLPTKTMATGQMPTRTIAHRTNAHQEIQKNGQMPTALI